MDVRRGEGFGPRNGIDGWIEDGDFEANGRSMAIVMARSFRGEGVFLGWQGV